MANINSRNTKRGINQNLEERKH